MSRIRPTRLSRREAILRADGAYEAVHTIGRELLGYVGMGLFIVQTAPLASALSDEAATVRRRARSRFRQRGAR